MERQDFEELITAALLTIPERIRSRMNNVAFVVEEERRKSLGTEKPIRRGRVLLGLYQGVPLARRGEWVHGSSSR